MSLSEWVASEVRPLRWKPLGWLSQHHFFRDPSRPTYSDTSYFFSPADGVIVYQTTVAPEDAILDIKGRRYCLKEVLRDGAFDSPSLVTASS